MNLPEARLAVLVVDDEAPARQRLTDLLRRDPEIDTLLEASDGRMAVETIVRERPDLVLLDIQMPELSGLDVVEAIGPARMPLTIFVSAYDQHAIRAFEAHALDYVLKPYGDERLEAAVARAKVRLASDRLGRLAGQFGRQMMQMMAARAADDAGPGPGLAPAQARYLDRLAVKSAGLTQLVRVAEIDWIDAAGVYVNLHVGGKLLLYRASLNDLSERLDPAQFLRVHRSTILNVDSIVRLESLSHGEFEVLLRDGARTRVSRTYRAQLEQRLGQAL